MTIIDSQFYIIDSLSLDVSFEWNANLVVAWLYVKDTETLFSFLPGSQKLKRTPQIQDQTAAASSVFWLVYYSCSLMPSVDMATWLRDSILTVLPPNAHFSSYEIKAHGWADSMPKSPSSEKKTLSKLDTPPPPWQNLLYPCMCTLIVWLLTTCEISVCYKFM